MITSLTPRQTLHGESDPRTSRAAGSTPSHHLSRRSPPRLLATIGRQTGPSAPADVRDCERLDIGRAWGFGVVTLAAEGPAVRSLGEREIGIVGNSGG